METDQIFTKLKEDMQKSVDHVLSEFATLHTGKANPSMVDGVNVEVYGSSMKLRDVAAITTPDARTLQIQAWDKGTVGPIEKALIDAKLGISPVVTGELIVCQFLNLAARGEKNYVKWLRVSLKTAALGFGHLAKTA